MPRTQITEIRKHRGRGRVVQITTVHPNRTFMAEESCLKSPHSFRMALRKIARTVPIGPLFDCRPNTIRTKGQEARMWQEILDGAK